MQSQKKIFNFYYDLCCQKLVVYAGTSADEIKSTIREILKIPSTAEVEYVDEEGYPIVISSALPNEIKISVRQKKTFTERLMESSSNPVAVPNNPQESVEWTWLETEHQIKNNNKTVYQATNERMARCKGSLIIESGEWYYKLIFDPLQCCVFASICDPSDSSDVDWMDFWRICSVP